MPTSKRGGSHVPASLTAHICDFPGTDRSAEDWGGESFPKTEKRASERKNNVLTLFIVMRTRKDEGNVDYKQLR